MLHGLNFRSESLPFVKLIKSSTYNDGYNPLSVGGFQIGMSLNKVHHSRSIYNALDLLGDVGGLYTILLDIGAIFFSAISFLFGSPLGSFLKSNIFTVGTKEKASKKSNL